jgi:hypothetical protein
MTVVKSIAKETNHMATWTSDELKKIEATEELQLASIRLDGKLSRPVTIWVVRVSDELFVRSVNGREGAWFRGTQVRHAGHIWVGGIEKDVSFEDGDPKINEPIDDAYRSKYHRYSKGIVNSVLTPRSRASTIKLVPQ